MSGLFNELKFNISYHVIFSFMSWFLTNISLFFMNSFLVVMAALMVITVTNPIYSILFLICVFIFTAFIFVLLNLHFLAMILLIVYLGAVCVLFLFVVMMLNIKMLELKRNINFIPFFFVLLSFIIFFFTINSSIQIWDYVSEIIPQTLAIKNPVLIQWPEIFYSRTSLEIIASVLYSFFFFQFIIAGLVLFLAMLSGILLTLENINIDYRKENFFFQILRIRKNRFFI